MKNIAFNNECDNDVDNTLEIPTALNYLAIKRLEIKHFLLEKEAKSLKCSGNVMD